MRFGKPLINHKQVYTTIKGQTICTIISQFPMIKDGKILGVIEIAKCCSDSTDVNFTTLDSTSNSNYQRSDFYSFSDYKTANKDLIEDLYRLQKMVTNSPNSNVFIYGETGTGKEILAQSIHSCCNKKDKPFIAQNCASIPESLAESIFFGTIKGSFTGAEDRIGLFERANGGTLFLDELNSMPIQLQPKLLRAIEQGKIRRVGAIKETAIDVRIIATVNEKPEDLINKKMLREDLFYRLCSIYVTLPPLRERKEDIAYLWDYYLNTLENTSTGPISISKEVIALFETYQWKGNVRELKNILESAVNTLNCDNIITLDHLSAYFRDRLLQGNQDILLLGQDDLTYNDRIEQFEKSLISEALNKSSGNISKAARMLKMKRQTLQHKINKLLSE